MQVVVVADAFPDVAFEAVDGEVHATQLDGVRDLLLSVDRQLSRGTVLVLRHEAGALDEHAAGAAGRVENPTVKRLQHLDEQANDADRGIELTAPRPLRASELTEEILIDPPERVALGARGNLRHLLE